MAKWSGLGFFPKSSSLGKPTSTCFLILPASRMCSSFLYYSHEQSQVFNSLCWKSVLKLGYNVLTKQTSSYIVEASGGAVLHCTGLRTSSFSPWRHTLRQYVLCAVSNSMADCDSPSPCQVLEESSTVLSWLTHELPQSGLLLIRP